MTNIYFARHGQSLANAELRVAGASDSPLTELGRRQAYEEAQTIIAADLHFDTIISSPLSRAYETASIIAAEIDFDPSRIIASELFIERHLGSFEGKLQDEFRAATEQEKEAAGCESLIDLSKRVVHAKTFVLEHAHGKTLVVAHAGFYRMSRCVAEGLPLESTYTLEQPKNSGVVPYPL